MNNSQEENEFIREIDSTLPANPGASGNNSQREELRKKIEQETSIFQDYATSFGLPLSTNSQDHGAKVHSDRIEQLVNAQIKAVLDRLLAEAYDLIYLDRLAMIASIQQERARLTQAGDGGEVEG